MASKKKDMLTNKQRVKLAAKISKPSMKSIALGYLDLDEETMENVDGAKKDDVEAFNREILKQWEYGNSAPYGYSP